MAISGDSSQTNLMKGINGYNNLCDELLAEILLRLPTKSAVRLKSVCKRWYSLISSPNSRFIHLSHHRDVESNLVFQINYKCDHTCNYGCKKHHSEFKTISNNSSLLLCDVCLNYLPTDLRLESSFKELILFSCITHTHEKKINYYVSNLLTRQWIALPPIPACEGYMSTCILYVQPHKFMVVRVSTKQSLIPSYRFDVQFFSSEDGRWRTLVVSPLLPMKVPRRYLYTVDTSLVAYRGMLHWLTGDCIAVYDPLNTPETFSHIIHHPIQPTERWGSSSYRLCVCQSHLRVVVRYDEWDETNLIVNVWELEDYDLGLWNLVHKVYINNLIYDNISLPISEKSLQSNLSILSFHPENEDVVYMRRGNGIVIANMKTRIVECYYPLKENTVIGKAFHLAHKWWPTQVSSLNRSMEAMLA